MTFQKGTERLLKQTIPFLEGFDPVVYLFRFLWDKIFYHCHLNLNVSDLLVSITGTDILDEEIYISFDSEEKKFLEADCCSNRVTLPKSHETYEEFANACSISVAFGSKGYGRF